MVSASSFTKKATENAAGNIGKTKIQTRTRSETTSKTTSTGWGMAGRHLVLFVAPPWLSVFFACVAHPKPLRYIFTAICVLFVMTFQFGTLAAMNSGFCDERNCKIGRSARYAIAAGVLYFVGGVMFIFTKNFPGRETEQHEQVKEVLALEVEVVGENGTHNDNDEEEPAVFETIEDFNDTDGISGAREVKPEAVVIY